MEIEISLQSDKKLEGFLNYVLVMSFITQSYYHLIYDELNYDRHSLLLECQMLTFTMTEE